MSLQEKKMMMSVTAQMMMRTACRRKTAQRRDIRDTQSAYPGYFERQREAKCGMHALNAAIGRYQGSSCVARRSRCCSVAYSNRDCMCTRLPVSFCTDADILFALDDYLATARREGHYEVRSKHWHPSGWYSSEVE